MKMWYPFNNNESGNALKKKMTNDMINFFFNDDYIYEACYVLIRLLRAVILIYCDGF